jgi:hypothetical protein
MGRDRTYERREGGCSRDIIGLLGKVPQDRVHETESRNRDILFEFCFFLLVDLIEDGAVFCEVLIETSLPAIDEFLDFQELVFVHPDAAALKALVEYDAAGVSVIEVLHLDAHALRAIEFVVVILFRGEYLFVHPLDGGDFLGGKDLVVVLENFLKFAGGQPLALALRTNLNLFAIVNDGVKRGLASGAIHNAGRLGGDRLGWKAFSEGGAAGGGGAEIGPGWQR